MNPRYGLCLNTLHDKAFDRGLMTVDTDFVIRISPQITVLENASSKRISCEMTTGGKFIHQKDLCQKRNFCNTTMNIFLKNNYEHY